jgi:hypothetical protein
MDMNFHLKRHSEAAVHTDVYQASRINIWRDHLPPVPAEGLMGKLEKSFFAATG